MTKLSASAKQRRRDRKTVAARERWRIVYQTARKTGLHSPDDKARALMGANRRDDYYSMIDAAQDFRRRGKLVSARDFLAEAAHYRRMTT